MKNFGLLSIAPRAMGRRIGLMILTAICALLLSRTAIAQPITIDGNPIDWTGVFSNNSIPIKTIVKDSVNANDDVYTGGGSKDEGPISGWQWHIQAANDKSDIENGGLALIGNKLYFFVDRFSTSGDANTGLWVMKNLVQKGPLVSGTGGFIGSHTIGDLFITMQFTGGGGHPERHIYVWNGSGLTEVMLSTAAADIASNQFNVYPTPAGAFPTGWTFKTKDSAALNVYTRASFCEGFVNLDSIPGTDFCFAEFFLSTRTSQSTNSLLEDLLLGQFATRPIVSVTDDTVCAGEDAVFTASVVGGIPPITYSWNGGPYAATNTYTISAATANTVIPVRAKGDNGCISTPDTAHLVVRPTPTVTATGDRTHCNGATGGSITFSSNPSGASFSWVGTRNVGFGTSGTVNPIPSYTATNTSSVTVTDTVIVTPTLNGCVGRADTFLVTVYPTPTVAPHDDLLYCNGDAAGAINFSGTPAGVSFSWVSNNNVGFGTSGSTNPIPAYTATNNGTTNLVGRVIVTPSANGCTGAPDTFLVTVKPTPNVSATGDKVYCPNVLADSIHFNSNVVGTSFSWTSSANVGFGLADQGTIPQYLTVNGGGAAIIATVIVTPSAASCIGRADTFLVTVNPNPGPNAPLGNEAVCNGNIVDTIHMESLDPAVTTHWSLSSDLGFGTSGDNFIPAFIGTNSGAAPIVVTVQVTASTNAGCNGTDTTAFLITINPDAAPNAPVDNFAICSGTNHDTIDIVGLNLVDTFHWTSSVDIGFGTSGTGKIPAFTATVTPVQMVATVTVTAVSPSGCPGETGGFVVTVNPLPVVVARDTSICAGVSFSLDLLSDPDGGTWSGTGSSGTTFNSAGLSAGAHGLKYTYTDANTCTSSDSAYVTILANPTVVARDTAICAGVAFSLNLLSDPDGGTWSGSGVSGTNFNSAGLSGTIGLFYNFSNGAGCSGSDSAYVTINPLPNVVARDTAICAGVSFSLNLLSDPDGGTWSGTGASGTTFNSAGLSGKNGLLYTYTDGNTCTSSDSAYVTINALPNVVARDTSICSGIAFSLNLLSDPDGGTWSGSGVSGTNFNSAGLGVGKFGLLYNYTDGNGCSSSDSAYVTTTVCGQVFATFTQGFWGSTNGKHCDGAGTKRNAVSLINYLLNLYGPMTIGRSGHSVVIPVTAAVALNAVMPGGKTPDSLKVVADVTLSNTPGSQFANNYLTGGRINNVFLSQVISLKLGTRIIPGLLGFPIQYDPAGASKFQTFGTSSSDCATFTVTGGGSCFSLKQSVTKYLTKAGTQSATLADLLNLADDLLGGALKPGQNVGGYIVPSYADVSGAIDLFNNAFDGFKGFNGYGCPLPKTPMADNGDDLEAAMRVYPNPTTGTFTIEIPAIDKDAHIAIVDLNGRTVKSLVIPANTYGQTQQVDLPRVAPGLYIIHVENNGHVFSKKIMVE